MKTFKDQYQKLQEILTEFEGGDLDLDEGIKKFAEGAKLSQELSEKIKTAKQTIEVLEKKYKIE